MLNLVIQVKQTAKKSSNIKAVCYNFFIMGFVEKISLERIYRLLELAWQEFELNPERSKKFVELAEKISQRNKVKIPKELRKNFCKKCHAFLKHGKNSAIRVTKNWLNVSCKECNHVEKIGLIENESKNANKKKSNDGKKA